VASIRYMLHYVVMCCSYVSTELAELETEHDKYRICVRVLCVCVCVVAMVVASSAHNGTLVMCGWVGG